MTPVRRAILAFLAARRLPASLEMIGQADGVRGQCGATTVYRTLMLFEGAEVVRLVGSPHKISYFVLNVPGASNHFLICRRCGCLAELALPPVMEEAIHNIGAAQGFPSTHHDCEVHGFCSACQSVRVGQGMPSKLSSGQAAWLRLRPPMDCAGL
ncbi:MAG: transcriptional repressor [Verrucomicrobiota bacterium]|nr:transcriptional repressor [Limisphaerales bacterium]